MNKTTSIYLDLVRFLAALTVFIVHANKDRFTGGLPVFWRISDYGNDAVMVFFVLSGFVIAYVANEKEKNIHDFFTSRLARLYSVVLPALVLTVILDTYGSQMAYKIYDGWWYKTDHPLLRFISNLFFINELWFYSIRPFSNGPFWSIGYEFWYYVIFGLAYYLKKPIKFVIIAIICLLVGPKILLLLPVWLMGVAVFKITSSKIITEKSGWFLLLLSFPCYLLYRIYGGQEYILNLTESMLGEELYDNLLWSKYFLSSYVIGLFISLNFIGFSAISHSFSTLLDNFRKSIRYLASYTFILYLAHYPLLQFFSALTFDNTAKNTQPVIVVAGTLFVVWLLGSVTEKQKGNYKRIFTALWLKLGIKPE